MAGAGSEGGAGAGADLSHLTDEALRQEVAAREQRALMAAQREEERSGQMPSGVPFQQPAGVLTAAAPPADVDTIQPSGREAPLGLMLRLMNRRVCRRWPSHVWLQSSCGG